MSALFRSASSRGVRLPVGRDHDRRAVLVRPADHEDVVALESVVPREDVGRHAGAGNVAEMARAARVRPRDGDEDLLRRFRHGRKMIRAARRGHSRRALQWQFPPEARRPPPGRPPAGAPRENAVHEREQRSDNTRARSTARAAPPRGAGAERLHDDAGTPRRPAGERTADLRRVSCGTAGRTRPPALGLRRSASRSGCGVRASPHA